MKGVIFIEPEYYVTLFDYDSWATRRILDVLGSNQDAACFDRCLDLMSHLLRSQKVWLSRIEKDDDAPLAIWERDSLAECTERSTQNTRNWLRFLSSCSAGDFNTQITYTNLRGETHTSELRDILTHVINHGTHHRAQISLLLRQSDIAPPPTDYIVYTRSLEGRD